MGGSAIFAVVLKWAACGRPWNISLQGYSLTKQLKIGSDKWKKCLVTLTKSISNVTANSPYKSGFSGRETFFLLEYSTVHRAYSLWDFRSKSSVCVHVCWAEGRHYWAFNPQFTFRSHKQDIVLWYTIIFRHKVWTFPAKWKVGTRSSPTNSVKVLCG